MIPTEFICYAATYARSGTYNSVKHTNQPNMKVDLQSAMYGDQAKRMRIMKETAMFIIPYLVFLLSKQHKYLQESFTRRYFY